MFGYYRRPDPGDVFASILLFIVLLVLFLAIAAYIGSIILFIFLGIGVAIGGIFALVIYIKEFINACRSLGSVYGKNGFLTFLLRWLTLLKLSTFNSFKGIILYAATAISNAGKYRFLNFKKWMWLIVAPSVLVFGIMTMLAVTFAHVMVLFIMIQLVVSVLLTIVAIYLTVCFVYSLIRMSIILASSVSMYNPFGQLDFTRTTSYSRYGSYCKGYYVMLFRSLGNIFNETLTTVQANMRAGSTYSIVSIFRWFYHVTPITLFPLSVLFSLVLIVAISIASIFAFLAQIIWTTIVKIFKL